MAIFICMHVCTLVELRIVNLIKLVEPYPVGLDEL